MSIFADALRWMGLLGPETAIVLDTIGRPVGDVEVRMLNPAGTVLDTTRTADDGTFVFAAGTSCPTVFDMVIDATGTPTTRRFTDPVGLLNFIFIRRPVVLTDTVGIEGANLPVDLRRVQDQLHHLGRLTDGDIAAEVIDPNSAAAIPASDVPRLMTALYAHARATTGETQPAFEIDSRAIRLLDALPPVAPLLAPADDLHTEVGEAPGAPGAPVAGALAMNSPADVLRVRKRLLQMGFLSLADYTTEVADPAAALNPVPVANLRLTIAAIKKFNDKVMGNSQHAIFKDREQARVLRDPYSWGQLPLSLQGSVGARGENRPRDVRRLQERLRDLELLTPANFTAEAVVVPAPTAAQLPIADNVLAQTIAAIQVAHVNLLGVAAPAPQLLERDDPALAILNHPPAVEIFEVADERPPIARPARTDQMNHPVHVRAVQDRLFLIGYLDQFAYGIERVNPASLAAVQSASMLSTLAAIRSVQDDLGIAVSGRILVAGGERLLPAHRPTQIVLAEAVGQGELNQPADVRPVQDRLNQLGILSDANYATERVDPTAAVAGNPLARTFEAIGNFRQVFFRRPAMSAMPNPWEARRVVEPDGDTLAMLNNPIFYARVPLRLTASVGELSMNRLDDVKAVQKRLNDLQLLSNADYAAETPLANRTERIRDDEMPLTIEALRTLRRVYLNENPAIGRIEASHPALVALSRPFERIRKRLDLTDTVGTGGVNVPADFAKVQDRLRDLCQLKFDDYETEAAARTDPINLDVMPETVAAILDWRVRNGDVTATDGLLERFRVPLRRLEWPLLPVPENLAQGIQVGVGAGGVNRNQQADVLAVQQRLHHLGLLATDNYVRERRIVQGLATINSVQMPETMDAILRFQNTAGGGIAGADRIISPNGHTERILKDPTYSTYVSTNSDTDNDHAGPGMPAVWHATATHHRQITAIILAIEAHEAGGSKGEVPAILRNGSQTPASFGKAQLIGQTAVGTVAAEASLGNFYDLDAAAMATLNAVVAAVDREWNRIFGLVPAGTTEAVFLGLITADNTANLAAFGAGNGFGAEDHVLMFRTAQFRRQVAAFIAPPSSRAAAVANIAAFMALPDVAANIAELNMRQADVRPFLATAIDNEHRGGFITRGLFRSEPGYKLKNAMTDDSGFKIGRFLIRDNYNSVLAGLAGATAANREQRARITARIHNSGAAGLAGFIANPATATNAYTNNVMPHWVAPGP
jgi:hypothetical protein